MKFIKFSDLEAGDGYLEKELCNTIRYMITTAEKENKTVIGAINNIMIAAEPKERTKEGIDLKTDALMAYYKGCEDVRKAIGLEKKEGPFTVHEFPSGSYIPDELTKMLILAEKHGKPVCVANVLPEMIYVHPETTRTALLRYWENKPEQDKLYSQYICQLVIKAKEIREEVKDAKRYIKENKPDVSKGAMEALNLTR